MGTEESPREPEGEARPRPEGSRPSPPQKDGHACAGVTKLPVQSLLVFEETVPGNGRGRRLALQCTLGGKPEMGVAKAVTLM